MKISSVTAIPVTHPAPREAPPTSLHDYPTNHLFVRIDTDEGLVGYGEVSDSYCCRYPLAMKAIVDEALTPLLLGEDAGAIGRLVAKMRGWTRREFCDQGAIIQAVSGIENALWDLLGKAQNRSVSQLFGQFRTEVPVYASGTFLGQGAADFHRALFEPCLNQGVRAVKVRMGPDYRNELETLRELRRALGDEVDVAVDGSEHFSATTALEIAKALADLGVLFFEEPVPQHCREAISRLVERSPLPIAYGEHLFTTHDFQDWLGNGRANIAQPDVAVCGGIAECRKIAAIAESFGVWVVPHAAAGPLVLAANLHYCASIQNVWMLEYAFTLDRLWADLLDEPVLSPSALRDGKLAVPDGPGLGLSIDESVFDRSPYRAQGTITEMRLWAHGNV